MYKRQVVTHSENLEPENRDLLKSCLARVNGIAENLLERRREQLSQIADNHGDFQVSSLASEFELVARQNLIHFDAHTVDIQLPSEIRQKFLRTLSNILSNSLKAVRKVESPKISLKMWEERDRYHVLITDNGVGMSNEQLVALRAGKFGSEENEGNGIGLRTAYDFINSVQGEMQMNSQTSQGTTTQLSIPRS